MDELYFICKQHLSLCGYSMNLHVIFNSISLQVLTGKEGGGQEYKQHLYLRIIINKEFIVNKLFDTLVNKIIEQALLVHEGRYIIFKS